MLYNRERVNPPRRQSNYKCVCAKQWGCKICENKTELKEEIDKSTIIVGDFTLPSMTVRITRRKFIKETEESINNQQSNQYL